MRVVPGAGLCRSLGPNFVSAQTTLRYNYQSLVTPSSVFDYDMNTGKATL